MASSSTDMASRSALVGVLIASAVLVLGCDEGLSTLRVLRPAFLYESAESCHQTRIALASGAIPPGVLTTVSAGQVLQVKGRDYSKEAMCVRVETQGREGFLVVSSVTTEWVKP